MNCTKPIEKYYDNDFLQFGKIIKVAGMERRRSRSGMVWSVPPLMGNNIICQRLTFASLSQPSNNKYKGSFFGVNLEYPIYINNEEKKDPSSTELKRLNKMVIDRGKIKVDPGVEYITQWIDNRGNYVIDKYLNAGKLIVNKRVTGCGFTTFCLINKENTILVSPRIRLIESKYDRFNKKANILYYFNREKKKGIKQKSLQDLAQEFDEYRKDCISNNRPLKLIVTYDSFSLLTKMLKNLFDCDISNVFRIAVDESHTLIKDVKLKEYSNKCVLSNFLQELFQYDKLLFISATPIVSYVSQIPQFLTYNVDYVELDWSNISPVNVKSSGCKNATDAFDQIYRYYSKHQDPSGKNYFDALFYGNGQGDYSYEAVIFLNSILDIKRIVNKYVNKHKLIDVSDISVICANTDENKADLHRTHPMLNITEKIPIEGERHKTWTFVTRTAFEGVDFCSSCASTYVVANYNVDSLSIDIASDIPQIIGRQRLKNNVFRNVLNIYYTNNLDVIDDEEFKSWQNQKMEISRRQIDLWQNTVSEYKDLCLSNITCAIERRPNDMYVKTVNGKPEIDPIIIISENYCRDIMKNHVTWYSIQASNTMQKPFSQIIHQLKDNLNNVSGDKKTQQMVKTVLECSMNNPELMGEIFRMLHDEGYNDIAYFFNNLSTDRIIANSCDPWRMEQEIKQKNSSITVADLVSSIFHVDQVYSKKDVKWILQEIYDKLGIMKTAKANELTHYISCKETKKNGIKAYKIIN